MKIDAKITRMLVSEKVKAYASICIDEGFVIYGIKIISGEKGTFIAMPTRKSRRGSYYDICFPISTEARKKIETAVMEAYQEKLKEI